MKNIYIASDHAGYNIKENLKNKYSIDNQILDESEEKSDDSSEKVIDLTKINMAINRLKMK